MKRRLPRRGSERPIRNPGGRAHRLGRRHSEGVSALGQEAASGPQSRKQGVGGALQRGCPAPTICFRIRTSVNGLTAERSTLRGPNGRASDFIRILQPRLPPAIPTRTVPASRILPKRTIFSPSCSGGRHSEARHARWAGLALPPFDRFSRRGQRRDQTADIAGWWISRRDNSVRNSRGANSAPARERSPIPR